MIINFSKSEIQIPQLLINDSPIDRVDAFKLLGPRSNERPQMVKKC
jgi:hypothetical protein